ncbi:MAG: recombinase family protein, partial [Oscillospiraceae bacterium]|nr:recombinase family protein [Oscillospiraceae bacterium]
FKLYLQNMGYDSIIKQMKQKGYKTNEGKDFTKSSINGILKNPKYMGTYVYDKSAPKDSEGKRNSHAAKKDYIQIKDGMPAIITPADFHKVQEKMANHQNKYQHRNSKHYYPLNGKLHCAKCGKAFSGNVNKCKGKSYYSYKATCTCGIKSIKMEKLNRFVFYGLQQCLFSADTKDKIIRIMNDQLRLKAHQRSAEVAAIKDKIDKLNLAQNNLTASLEAGIATATIMNKLQKNEKDLAALTAQLETKADEISMIDNDTYHELVNRFVNYMGNQKTPQAVDLRNAAIHHIDYGSDKTTIHFNRGISINEETREYFDNEKNWEATS